MRSVAPKPTANKQSLAVKNDDSTKVSYKDIDGNVVELSYYIVNNYLAPGSNFTQQECWTLINLSKARGLNPIAKDCYFLKYNGTPQVIVSKDYYTKRANKNSNYLGKENGIVVLNRNGEVEMRIGTIKLKDEELLGGWCKVYMANLKYPITVTASLDEYAPKKSDGELQATWKTKPGVMIEKVAIVRALKEAMTEEFQGTYAAEEFGEAEESLAANVADMAVDTPMEEPKPPKFSESNVTEASYVDVDESTGEVLEEEDDEQDFEDMQMQFFK